MGIGAKSDVLKTRVVFPGIISLSSDYHPKSTGNEHTKHLGHFVHKEDRDSPLLPKEILLK